MAKSDEYEIPDTGAVFTFGRSRFAENLSSHFFVRNDPILEISCGDEHTALVCKSGRVFLFGKNDYGQLGFGHTKVVNKPSCLKYLKPFQSMHVACGKGHTIVSTACCRLFAFGCNSDGQLGIGDLVDRTVPQLVSTGLTNEDSILAVAAGCHHSAFLTGKGELYLWGSNSDGQCGRNESKQFLIPKKLEFAQAISTVSCGYYHTAFISDGCPYTFGEEDNGKLGRAKKSSDAPEKVDIPEKCVSITCGGNHTIVQSETGKAFAFGSNFSGQLGIDSSESEFSVAQLVQFPEENVKLIKISCGESHSAFITDEGILYTCGDARYGKLCNEDESTNLNAPTVIDTFKNYFCTFVSCGGCHTMVIAKTNSPLKGDSSDSIKTVLPPIKLQKDEMPLDSPDNDLNGNTKKDTLPSLENQNEQEEFDNKSNTESNLNEDITTRDDEIYTEIMDVKWDETANANKIAREKATEQNESEIDVGFEAADSKIKRFLKRFKGKISNGKKTSINVKCEQSEPTGVNVNFKGSQTSKACIIL